MNRKKTQHMVNLYEQLGPQKKSRLTPETTACTETRIDYEIVIDPKVS